MTISGISFDRLDRLSRLRAFPCAKCFKIYTIVGIELNSDQAIEVVSVVRVVCDRPGGVSDMIVQIVGTLFETTGTIRTIIWKPGFKFRK